MCNTEYFLNELNALKRDYYYDWNMKRLTNYKPDGL